MCRAICSARAAQVASIGHNPRLITCNIELQSDYDMSVEVLARAMREVERNRVQHIRSLPKVSTAIDQETRALVPIDHTADLIHIIRGRRVMLDTPLGALLGVPRWRISDTVKRNPNRFPSDFAFQLTREEHEPFTSQSVNPNARSDRRRLPYVFTGLGVAMLSSVLRSKQALAVNIEIMRTFVSLRQGLATNAGAAHRWDDLKCHATKRGEHVQAIFDAILKLLSHPADDPNRHLLEYNPQSARHPIVEVMGLCLGESKSDH